MIPDTTSPFQLARWFAAIRDDMLNAKDGGRTDVVDAFLDEAELVVDLILDEMPNDPVGDFNNRYRLRQGQLMP